MIRILVTGSRDWEDRATIATALSAVVRERYGTDRLLLVHGDCPTGADHIADEIWCGWMPRRPGLVKPERHPAQWIVNGRRDPGAGPRRNAEMVALGADICLAFPLGESRGTRHCLGLAIAAGIPHRVFEGVAA